MTFGKQASSVISIFVALVLSTVVIFFRLGHVPIHLWDEARLATNAFEMYRTGYSWVTTFHYHPDTWNTKPPLLIWLQCSSLKLFGINETALRLPTAVAGVLTCLVVAWFCSRKLKNDWQAVLSVVVLCTCDGFVKIDHCVLTGDYDALLTFFTTCTMLSFYLAIDEGKRKYLIAAFAALALATLTKGVAALVFLPSVFLYAIYRRRLLYFLKQPAFYAAFISYCAVVVGYYLVREHYDPGYFILVIRNELGGRFVDEGMNASHPHETWFYLKLLTSRNFSYWWVVLIPGLLLSFFTKYQSVKRFVWFGSFSGILFLVIISCSGSKSEWYDAPVYPLFAIVTGAAAIFIYELAEKIKIPYGAVLRVVVLLIIMVFFLAKPYSEKLESVYWSGAGDWAVENTRMSTYLSQKLHSHDISNLLILRNDEYQANIDWYQEVINYNAHKRVVRTVAVSTMPDVGLKTGDTVAVYQDAEKQLLTTSYSTRKLADTGDVSFYSIEGTK